MKTPATSWLWSRLAVLAFVVGPAALAGSPGDEQNIWTLEQVLEVARDRAPEVRLATTQVLEARGRLVGARVLSRENPVVEGLTGPRLGNARSTTTGVSLAVPVELGGQRSKRIRAAESGLEREEYVVDAVRQRTAGAALADFYKVLHADGRLALADARRVLAEDLHRTALERHRTGDTAQIEVNLAESELSRARSALLAEQSAVARARAELAAVLGLPTGVRVTGKLEDRSRLDALMAGLGEKVRPDILAAEADVQRATSEAALSRTTRLPGVSFRMTYERDEEADTFLGGVAVALPLFDRGQGLRREAEARRERSQIELEARRSLAASELEGTRAAYASATDAVQELETHAIPRIAENENMARESYRAGKIDLTTLIVIRREVLETRREYLDRQLEAALAGIDFAVAGGVLP